MKYYIKEKAFCKILLNHKKKHIGTLKATFDNLACFYDTNKISNIIIDMTTVWIMTTLYIL